MGGGAVTNHQMGCRVGCVGSGGSLGERVFFIYFLAVFLCVFVFSWGYTHARALERDGKESGKRCNKKLSVVREEAI
jgi:hypothetical protein